MSRAKVNASDMVLLAGAELSNLVSMTNCEATFARVDFRTNSIGSTALALGGDSTFDGDRLRITGSAQPGIGLFGQRVSFRLTNSVLENVLFQQSTSDTGGPGSKLSLAHNTFVLGDATIDCTSGSGAQFRTTLFENNIVVAPMLTNVFDGPSCTWTNNVLYPQPAAPATNIVADPQFVDATARNYQLRATSPAVGAALTTPMVFTDHDHEGAPRPQGGAADIGAFEQ